MSSAGFGVFLELAVEVITPTVDDVDEGCGLIPVHPEVELLEELGLKA